MLLLLFRNLVTLVVYKLKDDMNEKALPIQLQKFEGKQTYIIMIEKFKELAANNKQKLVEKIGNLSKNMIRKC